MRYELPNAGPHDFSAAAGANPAPAAADPAVDSDSTQLHTAAPRHLASFFELQLRAYSAHSATAIKTNKKYGGRGIRTPGTLSGTNDFKSFALNRSAIPPKSGTDLILFTA